MPAGSVEQQQPAVFHPHRLRIGRMGHRGWLLLPGRDVVWLDAPGMTHRTAVAAVEDVQVALAIHDEGRIAVVIAAEAELGDLDRSLPCLAGRLIGHRNRLPLGVLKDTEHRVLDGDRMGPDHVVIERGDQAAIRDVADPQHGKWLAGLRRHQGKAENRRGPNCQPRRIASHAAPVPFHCWAC